METVYVITLQLLAALDRATAQSPLSGWQLGLWIAGGLLLLAAALWRAHQRTWLRPALLLELMVVSGSLALCWGVGWGFQSPDMSLWSASAALAGPVSLSLLSGLLEGWRRRTLLLSGASLAVAGVLLGALWPTSGIWAVGAGYLMGRLLQAGLRPALTRKEQHGAL